jgi:hypothetical protein
MTTYAGGVLADGTLITATAGSETTVATADGSVNLDSVLVKNTSATASCTLTVWAVPVGHSATSPIAADMIIGPLQSFPPLASLNIADLIKRLDNGDKIVALAGTASVMTMRVTRVVAT